MMNEDERNELVITNLPFIYSIVNRYSVSAELKQDLVQEGILGLIRATEKFDASRNVKFLTYANYWIKVFIQRYAKNQENLVSMEDDQVNNIPDNKVSVETLAVTSNLKDKVINALVDSGATDREVDIILSRYFDDGITLQQLGERHGICRERVRQLENIYMDKLKKRVENGKF